MLLQISEPGEAKAKEACKKRVVGIDLGTTNSLVAVVGDAKPRVLGGEANDPLVPSVVAYGGEAGGAVVVGREAVKLAASAPASTIASAKRLVGRGKKDVAEIAKLLPYALAGDDRAVAIAIPGRAQPVSPVEVSAEILKALRQRAERELGGAIEGAVITVPAYFDDAQRQATRDAGRLAGLEVMRLLAEPTAAALAYGLDRGSRGVYAVFDLGGGTFDISVLKLVDGVFEVKATGGDSALGGDDLDRAIATAVLGAERLAGDVVGPAVAEGRRVKEALSVAEAVVYRIAGVEKAVTRAELAAWAKPLLDRCAKACRRAVADAELTNDALDGVILVGGSTRSPVVREFVATLFGRPLLDDLDPDQVVALGAAVQADALAGGEQQVVLLDVVPLSLGVEMMGGVVEKLVHRNTTIPCGATQTFTTYADNQTGFVIHVVQGERETVDACRSLATFTLRGIPPMVAGLGRVEITFLIDADGLLKVMATELTTGISSSIEVKPSYGLSDEEVERMLIESFEHAEDDLVKRNLLVERVEAERILAATRAAFASDAALLDSLPGDIRAAGAAAMAVLEAAMAGENYLAIRDAVGALDVATKDFAQARMNRAITAGFAGVSLDEAARKVGAH